MPFFQSRTPLDDTPNIGTLGEFFMGPAVTLMFLNNLMEEKFSPEECLILVSTYC